MRRWWNFLRIQRSVVTIRCYLGFYEHNVLQQGCACDCIVSQATPKERKDLVCETAGSDSSTILHNSVKFICTHTQLSV